MYWERLEFHMAQITDKELDYNTLSIHYITSCNGNKNIVIAQKNLELAKFPKLPNWLKQNTLINRISLILQRNTGTVL